MNYSIVMPTRGSGDSYNLLIKYFKIFYEKNLIADEILEFIIICPEINLLGVKNDFQNFKFNLIFYTDEEFIELKYKNSNNWGKQQIIKLKISLFVKTKFYLIIDDDMFLIKKLNLSDFFDKEKICYSYESFTDNSSIYQNHTVWLTNACKDIGCDLNYLKSSKDIMGVTPQLLITDIVKELIEYLDYNLEISILKNISNEFGLYWCFLIKTNRTYLYTPNNKFFIMDCSIQLINKPESKEEIIKIILKNIIQKQNYFLVLQSHLKISFDILDNTLQYALKYNN